MKLEGENGGKEKGTAPAENTTATVHLDCLAVDACCECGPTSTCKTARCKCRKAARVCMTCRCLGQCSNRAPQTRRDGTTLKGKAEGKTGKGEGKRKQRRGRLKENATPRTTQARTGREATGEEEAKSAGDRVTTTSLEEGEGTEGDVSEYQPTPEDLCLWEVYRD